MLTHDSLKSCRINLLVASCICTIFTLVCRPESKDHRTRTQSAANRPSDETASRVTKRIVEAAERLQPTLQKLNANYVDLKLSVRTLPDEFKTIQRFSGTLYQLFNMEVPSFESPSYDLPTAPEDIICYEEFPRWLVIRDQNEATLTRLLKISESIPGHPVALSGLEEVRKIGPRIESASQAAALEEEKQRIMRVYATHPDLLKTYLAELDRNAAQAEREAKAQRKKAQDVYDSEVRSLEEDINRARQENVKKIKALLEPLRLSFATMPTDRVRKNWEAYNESKDALVEMVGAWQSQLDRQMPALADSELSGLTQVGGITHLVDAERYFIDNKVISIPADSASLYVSGSAGPNEMVVDGYFRFMGNSKGTNSLGLAINVETYECDERFTEMLRRQNKYLEATAFIREALERWNLSNDRDFVSATGILVRSLSEMSDPISKSQ